MLQICIDAGFKLDSTSYGVVCVKLLCSLSGIARKCHQSFLLNVSISAQRFVCRLLKLGNLLCNPFFCLSIGEG